VEIELLTLLTDPARRRGRLLRYTFEPEVCYKSGGYARSVQKPQLKVSFLETLNRVGN